MTVYGLSWVKWVLSIYTQFEASAKPHKLSLGYNLNLQAEKQLLQRLFMVSLVQSVKSVTSFLVVTCCTTLTLALLLQAAAVDGVDATTSVTSSVTYAAVNEGDQVQVSCTVAYLSPYFMLWLKTTPDGQVYQLAENANFKSAYTSLSPSR